MKRHRQASAGPVYVYAVVRAPLGGRSPWQKGKLRLVRERSTAAIVADCRRRPAITPGVLRAHDTVVRRIARSVGAVLPVRFGTLADGDRSVRDLLRARRSRLLAALRQVEQREQMTVRLFGRPRKQPRGLGVGGGKRRGTAYLMQRATARGLAADDPELEPLQIALRALVTAERIVRHDAGPLLLTAYHLIPRGTAAAYRPLLRRHRLPEGLRASVSGPWPPYAFGPEF